MELWVASLLGIVLVTVVLNQVAQWALRQAAKATARKATVWDDALLRNRGQTLVLGLWWEDRKFKRTLFPQGCGHGLAPGTAG